MRIAYFVNRFPSLTERFVVNQMSGVLKHGHELDIFAKVPGPGSLCQQEEKELDLYQRLHQMPIDDAGADSKRLLRLRQHEMIHAQFGPWGVRAVELRSELGLSARVITSFRGYDASRYPAENPSGIYDQLFEEGDLFLAVSESIRQSLVKLGCPDKKICIHRSGIEIKKFPYSTRCLPGDGRVRLITVARLVEKKGLEFSIQGVARLIRKFPNLQYDIVGEGVLEHSLARIIRSTGLQKNIHLLGSQTQAEVIRLLDRAHIYVCPSVTAADGDREGIPNALKEAMLMGLPVVASRHAGIPELVSDGINGLLVPERSSEDIANKLEYLLDSGQTGHHLWARMGEAAHSSIRQNYDSDKLNDSLETLYRDVAHG